MLIVAFKPRCDKELMQGKSLHGVHLETTVEELEQLVAHVRVRQRELAADYVLLVAEGIAAEDAEIEGHTDRPRGRLLTIVHSVEDPLRWHALQCALEFPEGIGASAEVSRRAEVNDLDRVVLQVDEYVLGLDVPVHDALGEHAQVDAYELGEDLAEHIVREGERLAVAQVEESDASVELLHHDDKTGGLLEEVVDAHDAGRVAQTQQTLDLEGQVGRSGGARGRRRGRGRRVEGRGAAAQRGVRVVATAAGALLLLLCRHIRRVI